MSKEELLILKPCCVMLEQITPKAQKTLSAELRKVIEERNILTCRSKQKLVSALELTEVDKVSGTEIKREIRKNNAIQEILHSEYVYLQQLEIIMLYFMKPIKDQNILNEFEYEILFKNIENIYKVNGELLNELKKDLKNVAKAFSKLAPFFKMYSVYAYNYKNCINLLEKLHSRTCLNDKFCKILEDQESRPEVQAKLSSMLITPIQRIPRYCLLIKQVLDNTLPSDPDQAVLEDSLKQLENVARHVNSLVEERENSQRLLELIRCLKNNESKSLVIKPGRKILKEGKLNRFTENKLVEIYIVLMSDILMICKIKNKKITVRNSLKCTYIFPLTKCKLCKTEGSDFFEIICKDEKIVLCDIGTWYQDLDESIRTIIKNRQTLKKGSSARRPASVYKNELGNFMDVGVSPGVSRIKKRRRTEDENDDDEKVEKVLKFDETIQPKSILSGCIPRISKRKTIRTINQDYLTDIPRHEIPPPVGKTEKERDSLFPLRQHVLCENKDNTTENEPAALKPCGEVVDYQRNVFVFGQNDRRRFSFNGFFTGIKKVFGFKN